MTQQTEPKPDVVEFLEAQHDEIRTLFADLRSASAADKGDVFQCLVRLLAVHETAEEMAVHPAVRRAEGGDAIVQRRLDEESEAKQMLADLEDMGVDDPRFSASLAAFEQAVLGHAEQEEQQEFPLLYEVHDEEVLRGMTSQVKVAEAMAPTHPHPHGPESATGNLLVGPFVSMVDRVRDALRRS
jgi:hemerythrin superfamily protein